jgi:hypothetical protein
LANTAGGNEYLGNMEIVAMWRHNDLKVFGLGATHLVGAMSAIPVPSDPVEWRLKDGENGQWYEGIVATMEAEADTYAGTELILPWSTARRLALTFTP